MAQGFFEDGEISLHGVKIGKYPPLYPMLISPAYLFDNMGEVYFFIKVINAILSSLIIFPTWLFSKKFLSKKKAILTALLISLIPTNFAYTPYILSENLFYPLFLLSIYALYQAITNKTLFWTILAATFSGLSILTKITGLLLAFVAFFSFIYYIYIEKENRIKYFKLLSLFLTIFLAIFSIWAIRNALIFGFTLSGLFGSYISDEMALNGLVKYFNLIFWIFMYVSYLLLGTLFLFPYYFFNIVKLNRFKTFVILTFMSIAGTLILAANHASAGFVMNPYFSWILGRPIGRYIGFVFPLVIIGGMVGIFKASFKKQILRDSLLTFFTIFASFLTLFSLFPVNNSSLIWSDLLIIIMKPLISNSLIFMVLFSIFFLILGLILIRLIKWKYFVYFLILIFFIFSILNYAATYYNTTNYWCKDQVKLGKYMDEYDSEFSTYLLDKDAEFTINKYNQKGIYEMHRDESFSSIIGFWLKDKIVLGDIYKDREYVDYIYTKQKLSLPLIKEEGNFKIYSTKDL